MKARIFRRQVCLFEFLGNEIMMEMFNGSEAQFSSVQLNTEEEYWKGALVFLRFVCI